jgi:RNA polymerase II C-terminal domain phosphatase-like 3/4
MRKVETLLIQDVEEGEISDSGSVEEITKEDFVKPEAAKVSISTSDPKPMIWTIEDLYKYQNKYQTSRNCTPGFHNLAWRQAVQNKPLGEILEFNRSAISNSLGTTDDDDKKNDAEDAKMEDVDGGEKEEGEIEEGEIDLDYQPTDLKDDDLSVSNQLEKRVKLIREGLESVILNDEDKSYDKICSTLQSSLDGLSQLLQENSVPEKDDLAQLSSSALQSVRSVVSCIIQDTNASKPKSDSLLRLLDHVLRQKPPIFNPEQIKEIEDVMIPSLSVSPSVKGDELIHVELDKKEIIMLKVPLIDLHMDHDVDSLPSPTREGPPAQACMVADGRPEYPVPLVREKRGMLHPYETDAVKAVSFYQQKFGRSSHLMNNDRLPSPTPSDDEDRDADGDTTTTSANANVSVTVREVSNSSSILVVPSTVANLREAVNSPYSGSTTASVVLRPTSAKRRDPRLARLINAAAAATNTNQSPSGVKDSSIGAGRGTRKQKITMEESTSTSTSNFFVDGPLPKRQRNEYSIDSTAGGGGAGVEVANRTPLLAQSEILTTSSTENGQLPSALSVAEKLRNIIKMHEPHNSPPTPSLSLGGGLLPLVKSIQTPQTSSVDEAGKVRMKPRDPRRVLHTNSSSQSKTKQVKAILTSQKPHQEDQLLKTSTTATVPPDIGQQIKSNLNSITDNPLSTNPPTTTLSSQVHPSWVDVKGRAASEPGLEEESKQSNNNSSWSNIEHLFDGFDEQQKAAIQKERTRRIEEQNKMFSARKLCLVLDLDHTLLNSAKFVEIEPAHDELLRKKEEQDREKPHRHLFRFPHMGMWTKLRPGVWNFLEKASKLFEMHLYTMGNKLYATEMAKVLDPKGVLFSGRVISKGDDGDIVDGEERIPKSKDLEGVLGMESAVVIIDDSVKVWPHNKLNLILVERYIYFPCSRRQFGLPGLSLLEIDHDERPEDGTLASSMAVIERIHEKFFSSKALEEADVRTILAQEQQKILGGCKIVFSRVFPVGEANPHMHPLWQQAEQFGAVCTTQIDDQVTHVVANSLGTDKVNWALSTGRFVVHPGWVEASTLLYRRVNEHDFAIKP